MTILTRPLQPRYQDEARLPSPTRRREARVTWSNRRQPSGMSSATATAFSSTHPLTQNDVNAFLC